MKKGMWKRFWHTLVVAKIPLILFLVFVILEICQGQIVIRVPEANANLFSGDVSKEAVFRFIFYELTITVTSQIVLYMNHILRYKMNRNLRNALWGKILKMKPSYYDKVSSNSLISRITIDSDSINEFVLDVVFALAYEIYYLVLTIREMNRISVNVGFILLAFMPITFIVTFITGRINLKFNDKLKNKLSDMTMYLSELISCLPLLKSVNHQAYEAKRGQEVIDGYYKSNRNIVFLTAIRSFIGNVISIGPEVVIIILGIKFLNNGTLDTAGWYVFYIYAGTFIAFCSTLSAMWEKTKSIQGSLFKVSDVLYEKSEVIGEIAEEIVKSEDIIFDHVSFAYDKKLVLDDISFTLAKNKTTAIIGFSGSGKSTILKLLERFYDPTEGRILMGGKEIKDIGIKEWRKQIAYVSQSTPLMSGSIRENILYGIKREVSDEEIMEAAAKAHVDEFIMESAEGLDRQVGQFGEHLSGGQRQKISIARAILTQANILILDEPTASLDIVSTNEIRNTIERILGERTVILVTHESKMIECADYVIAVDEDHRAVAGTVEEMRRISDFYNDLVKE